MRPVLCVSILLLGLPLAYTFILHPPPEAVSEPAVRAKRCRGELEIRKILLESLSLQQEPRVSVSRMNLLRAAFKRTVPSSAGNSSLPEDSANSTCCRHSSQVFMEDLGWERWVVYPESITFIQCGSCGPSLCAESASAQCCRPTAHAVLPFLYVDEWSALVLSSVSLTRECGCDPPEPEVTTPALP